ncbi:fibrinogen alpha chain [Narcine bancroftii]|uniref:fibrinogen alpha chain n=1 Tax=Narcine bancroftii TaxID=1343680 RepID=UPI003831EF2A
MRGTLVLGLIIGFINLAIPLSILSPRGPRPVVSRQEKASCSEEDKWPVCDDDDMGHKCPSGCRLKGKIEIQNMQNDDRVHEIRQMLREYSEMFGSTYNTVQEVGNRLKQSLDRLGNTGETYYRHVDRLNSRLITVQNRINEQVFRINILRNSIVEQFKDITKLEVDIDIKIRACKGSCKRSYVYHIDKGNAAQLQKNYRSLTSLSIEKIHYRKPTHTFNMRVLRKEPTNIYQKSGGKGIRYSDFWKETNEMEFTLKKNTDDSKGATGEPVNYGTAVPGSLDKVTPEAIHTSSSSRGDDISISPWFSHSEFHEPTSHLSTHYFSHTPDINKHTSYGVVTTKTIISKDGKVTETVTSDVSDSFPPEVDHFRDTLKVTGSSQIKGSASSTDKHTFRELGNLHSSGTKSTMSMSHDSLVNTRGTTNTDDLDEFSNLGEHSDFMNLNIKWPSDNRGESSSTKTVRVSHESETHRSESHYTKGFTSNQGVKVASFPNDESGGNQTSHLH